MAERGGIVRVRVVDASEEAPCQVCRRPTTAWVEWEQEGRVGTGRLALCPLCRQALQEPEG